MNLYSYCSDSNKGNLNKDGMRWWTGTQNYNRGCPFRVFRTVAATDLELLPSKESSRIPGTIKADVPDIFITSYPYCYKINKASDNNEPLYFNSL